LVAAVVVARDDEDIAANSPLARRCEPIGPTSLDQLDELELVGRQAPAKRLLFVRRIDGDRADGFFIGVCVVRPAASEQDGQAYHQCGAWHRPTNRWHLRTPSWHWTGRRWEWRRRVGG